MFGKFLTSWVAIWYLQSYSSIGDFMSLKNSIRRENYPVGKIICGWSPGPDPLVFKCWPSIEMNCCKTICLVESHSQDVNANTGVLSVLPHTFHVRLTSVAHCHPKREYTCDLDSVSFIEILATINLYYNYSFLYLR